MMIANDGFLYSGGHNGLFCNENDGFCIKNDEFCIKKGWNRYTTDAFCIAFVYTGPHKGAKKRPADGDSSQKRLADGNSSQKRLADGDSSQKRHRKTAGGETAEGDEEVNIPLEMTNFVLNMMNFALNVIIFCVKNDDFCDSKSRTLKDDYCYICTDGGDLMCCDTPRW